MDKNLNVEQVKYCTFCRQEAELIQDKNYCEKCKYIVDENMRI